MPFGNVTSLGQGQLSVKELPGILSFIFILNYGTSSLKLTLLKEYYKPTCCDAVRCKTPVNNLILQIKCDSC